MQLSLSAGGVSAKTIGDMLEEQAAGQLAAQPVAGGTTAVTQAIRGYVESVLSDLVGSASVSVSLSINISRTQMPVRSPDVG